MELPATELQQSRRQFLAMIGCAVGAAVIGSCSQEDAKVAGVSTSQPAKTPTTASKPTGPKVAGEHTSLPNSPEVKGASHTFDLANWQSWTSIEVMDQPPNSEEERYTASAQNVRYENGSLLLEAHGNTKGNITSGRLFSGSKWRMGGDSDNPGAAGNRFGRIDVSAKLPGFKGSWPAIWLFDKDVAKGTAPEIDIMEFVGAYPGEINSSFHDQKYNPDNGNERSGQVVINSVTSSFHTYSLIWVPHHVEAQVDGRKVYAVDATDDPANPFYKTTMGLVLNLAVGGSWGGAVDYGAVDGSRMEINKITFTDWQ